MSTVAAVASPWIGLICGLLAWFITTWKRSGEISVVATGDTTNAVAGNVASLGVGAIMAVGLSYVFPGKYQSDDAGHVERSNKIMGIGTFQAAGQSDVSGSIEQEGSREEQKEKEKNLDDEGSELPVSIARNGIVGVPEAFQSNDMQPMDPKLVRQGEKLTYVANIIFVLVAVILVPFTLFGTSYIFSKSFFTGWVVVSFIWVWVSMVICVIYPVVESTASLRGIGKGVWRDVRALAGLKIEKRETMTGGNGAC